MCTFIPTADIADIYGNDVVSCDTQMRDFGGKTDFAGRIVTIRCFQDNQLVKEMLNSPGEGKVLVVDAGGNTQTAMVGDKIAQAAVDNGWRGIVVNGAIRDSAGIAQLPIAVKAIGTNPRKSAKDGLGVMEVPLTFGGVTFIPGHTLYADGDGIILMPEPLMN